MQTPCTHPRSRSQITDDSELALCLGGALAGADPSAPVPLDAVAFWYGRWLDSPPFDIGERVCVVESDEVGGF